jgi:hypothetical protein
MSVTDKEILMYLKMPNNALKLWFPKNLFYVFKMSSK